MKCNMAICTSVPAHLFKCTCTFELTGGKATPGLGFEGVWPQVLAGLALQGVDHVGPCGQLEPAPAAVTVHPGVSQFYLDVGHAGGGLRVAQSKR